MKTSLATYDLLLAENNQDNELAACAGGYAKPEDLIFPVYPLNELQINEA